jgi:secretion/DNA translocation related TadE-like protein
VSARRSRGEAGLAAPAVVTLAGLLVVVTGLAVTGGRLLLDHRRAAAAADLAALAAATAVQHGADGCAEARRYARLNRTALTGCSVDGEVVTVRVELAAQVLLGRRVVLRADARAGPVT